MKITLVNILQKQVFFIIILLCSFVTCSTVLLSFHTFSLIIVAVMMLNVLFCRLNALLQGLAYMLGVYSCIGFANFLKSRMRRDKAECWKPACQTLVETLL